MTGRVKLFLKQLVVLFDCAAITSAFFVAYFFRQSFQSEQRIFTFYGPDSQIAAQITTPLRSMDSYLGLLLIILPLWIWMLYIQGSYAKLRRKKFNRIRRVRSGEQTCSRTSGCALTCLISCGATNRYRLCVHLKLTIHSNNTRRK